MTASVAAVVQRDVTLPVPRERAWEAITDPAQLAQWLADEVELEPRAGGAVAFRWDDGASRTGVVEECAAPRRLAFRWIGEGADDESLVEITLDDVEDGTRVSVIEIPVAARDHGPALLASAGGPTAWGARTAALAACGAGVRV